MSSLQNTAALFRANRRRWVSVTYLIEVGGWCRWRTAVSECRTKLGMRVENKLERKDGRVQSFYRYRGKAA